MLLSDGERELLKTINNLKDGLRSLELDHIEFTVGVAKKLYSLENTISWLSIATSLSFLLAFLLIAHIARYI